MWKNKIWQTLVRTNLLRRQNVSITRMMHTTIEAPPFMNFNNMIFSLALSIAKTILEEKSGCKVVPQGTLTLTCIQNVWACKLVVVKIFNEDFHESNWFHLWTKMAFPSTQKTSYPTCFLKQDYLSSPVFFIWGGECEKSLFGVSDCQVRKRKYFSKKTH